MRRVKSQSVWAVIVSILGAAQVGLSQQTTFTNTATAKTVFSEQQRSQKPVQQQQIRDIALRSDGILAGIYVTKNGAPVRNGEVQLLQSGKSVITMRSNDNGEFIVRGLRGGLYQVATKEGIGQVRLWTANAAPPSARKGLVLVAGGSVVRAQDQDVGYTLFDPYAPCWQIVMLTATGTGLGLGINAIVENNRLRDQIRALGQSSP